MIGNDHWIDERGAKHSAFDRQRANLPINRSGPQPVVPAQKITGTGGKEFADALQAGAIETGPQDIATPASHYFTNQRQVVGSNVSNLAVGSSVTGSTVTSTSASASTSQQGLAPAQGERLTESQIWAQAILDPQTRVLNFRYATHRLRYELERAQFMNRSVGVLVVAIDGMQSIGMECGAMALDKLVESLALVLVNSCRKIDLVGRFCEGRFIIICPEISNAGINNVARVILETCSVVQVNHQWHSLKLGVSIGAAVSSDEVNDPEVLIALADLNADTASESGGNCLCLDE